MILSLFLVATILAALLGAAFCAGAETAFMSVSRGRVLHLVRAGSAAARIVQSALSKMNRTLTTLLIGNNISHVVFSSAAAALGARLCESQVTLRAVWTFVSAFIVLYLGEFLPKLFCSTCPLRRSLLLAPAFRIVYWVLHPLTRVAMAVTGLFIPKAETKESGAPLADLVRILEDRRDGVKLSDFESALISRILVLRRRKKAVTVDALLRALDLEDL
ncbi:MAG: CNNM domain-containing protein [Kiritimatiellia bacterium]